MARPASASTRRRLGGSRKQRARARRTSLPLGTANDHPRDLPARELRSGQMRDAEAKARLAIELERGNSEYNRQQATSATSVRSNSKEGGISLTDRPQNRQQARQRRKPIYFGKSFFARNQSPNLFGFTARSMEARRLRAHSSMRFVSGASIGAAQSIQPLRSRALARASRSSSRFRRCPANRRFSSARTERGRSRSRSLFRNLLASASQVGSPAANFAPATRAKSFRFSSAGKSR